MSDTIAEVTASLTRRMFIGMAMFDIAMFAALHQWPPHL